MSTRTLVIVTFLAPLATLVASCRSAGPAAQQNDESFFRAGDVRQITILGTDVSFDMAFVPGGTTTLGSPPDESGRDADEGPRVDVQLDGFWMGRFEVTGDEFGVYRFPEQDADTTGAKGKTYSVDAVTRPSTPYEDPTFGMGTERTPATGMTQWGALQYARWLTEKTGIFFRLPTEAEWEYACHAGSNTVYAFGNDPSGLDSTGWYRANSSMKLHPVGELAPNAWGIYDMHGNASEWTMDEYRADFFAGIQSGANNPWAESTRRHPRTVRGGAYDDAPSALRCAARLESSLNWKRRDPQIPKSSWWNTDSPFLGFRLVAPLDPPDSDEQEVFWRKVLGE